MTGRRSSGVGMAVALASIAAIVAPIAVGRAAIAAAAVDPVPGLDTTYGTGGDAVLRPSAHAVVVNDVRPGPAVFGSVDGYMSVGTADQPEVRSMSPAFRVAGVASDRGAFGIVAGVGDVASGHHPELVHYGDFVEPYGLDGVVTVPVTSATDHVTFASDNFTLAGLAVVPGGTAVYVARIDQLGLSATWGTDGVTLVDLGSGEDELIGVYRQYTMTFVVGRSGGHVLVAKLGPDGMVDPSFGTGGVYEPTLPDGADITSAALGYGEIMLGGSDALGHALVAHIDDYDPTLSTVVSAAVDGAVLAFSAMLGTAADTSVVTVSGDTLRWVKLTETGQIAAGSSVVTNSMRGVRSAAMINDDAAWLLTDTATVRRSVFRNPDRYGDETFALDWSNRDWIQPLAVGHRADGSAVVVGNSRFGNWLASFSVSGQPDGAFGGGFAYPLLFGDPIRIDVLANGKMLVATAHPSHLYRLNPDATIDRSYGVEGRVLFAGPLMPDAVIVDPDGGAIVVADQATRLSPDGTPDPSFGDISGPNREALTAHGDTVVYVRRTSSGLLQIYPAKSGGSISAVMLTAAGDVDLPTLRTIADVGAVELLPVVVPMADGTVTFMWTIASPSGPTLNRLTAARDDGVKLNPPVSITLPTFSVPRQAIATPDGGLLVALLTGEKTALVTKFRSDLSVERGFGIDGSLSGEYPGGFTRLADGRLITAFAQPMASTPALVLHRLAADQPPIGVRARYVALSTPVRLVDTRQGGTPLAAGVSQHFPAAGVKGIPANATALATNFTIAGAPPGAGYAQVFGPGTVYPGFASSLNLRPTGGNTSAFALVRLGTAGSIATVSTQPGNAIVDVFGYWVPAATATSGRYVAEFEAHRLLDTRQSSGGGRPLAANVARSIPTGRTGAIAVVVNITVVRPSADGFLKAYGANATTTSNVNFVRGETKANLAVVPITAQGSLRVAVSVSSHVLVDIVGYMTGAGAVSSASGLFVAQTPTRVLDTRTTVGYDGRIRAGVITSFHITGTGGLPADATAAVVSVVSVGAVSAGYLEVVASIAAPVDATSLLNVPQPMTAVSNSTVAGLSAGNISIYSTMSTNVVIDVAGWFTT